MIQGVAAKWSFSSLASSTMAKLKCFNAKMKGLCIIMDVVLTMMRVFSSRLCRSVSFVWCLMACPKR